MPSRLTPSFRNLTSAKNQSASLCQRYALSTRWVKSCMSMGVLLWRDAA